MEHKTQKQVGNTVFILTSECSGTATETVVQKLERLICRRVSDTKSYQVNRGTALAMCETIREYGTNTIKKE